MVRVRPAAIGYFTGDAAPEITFPETHLGPAEPGLRSLIGVLHLPGIHVREPPKDAIPVFVERGEAVLVFEVDGPSYGLAVLTRALDPRYPNGSFAPRKRGDGVWFLPTWKIDVEHIDVAPFVVYVLRGDPQTANALAAAIGRITGADSAVGAMFREGFAHYPVPDDAKAPVSVDLTTRHGDVWGCKIGPARDFLSPCADSVMRDAVEGAFRKLTGHEALVTYSGWGQSFTKDEIAAIPEGRRPRV